MMPNTKSPNHITSNAIEEIGPKPIHIAIHTKSLPQKGQPLFEARYRMPTMMENTHHQWQQNDAIKDKM